ncbi:glycerophosphodiester phosphodiesterase [Lasius niger]|uniref:Glycerophosphodiester phosphodiesterase n=1 Tax=Lasius niger TaxID=67767 RepID=A0A0J7K5J1_LASNI|nr:glycerophosphodiester phosphodiesterase [Lasius niger]
MDTLYKPTLNKQHESPPEKGITLPPQGNLGAPVVGASDAIAPDVCASTSYEGPVGVWPAGILVDTTEPMSDKDSIFDVRVNRGNKRKVDDTLSQEDTSNENGSSIVGIKKTALRSHKAKFIVESEVESDRTIVACGTGEESDRSHVTEEEKSVRRKAKVKRKGGIPTVGVLAIEWLDEIDMIRIKCDRSDKTGKLQGVVNRQMKDRVRGITEVVHSLIGIAEDTGDPSFWRSKNMELTTKLKEVKRVEQQRRKLEKAHKKIRKLKEKIKNLTSKGDKILQSGNTLRVAESKKIEGMLLSTLNRVRLRIHARDS